MSRAVSRSSAHEAAEFLSEVADGSYSVCEEWVLDSGVSVVAQETSGKLDPDQSVRLVRAARDHHIDLFVGIANDDAFVKPRDIVMGVSPTVEGFARFDLEFFGLNAALLHPKRNIALIATVDDFSILAAPRDFVVDYEPNPVRALEDFRTFAVEQDPQLRPAAYRALALFERYGPF